VITKNKLAQCSETELISMFVQGNDRAFNVLVNRTKSLMMSAILRIVKDRDQAEDLYQDALIKLLTLLRDGRYKDEGKFNAFAQRIASNVAIDHFRKLKRRNTTNVGDNERLLESHAGSFDNAEMHIIRKETDRQVRQMIFQLPDNQREVLILRHYHDCSFKEIAQFTDTGINTALGRMRYALSNLRKLADSTPHRISA
jgi:RNA polymerase sigma-70 factor (ECF subfamily)